MPTFNDLRIAYDRGQTEDVLSTLNATVIDLATDEGKSLSTLKGWCHYRRKEYDKAHDSAIAAGNFPWARELMAYLYAYAPGYVNDEGLKQIAEELGSSNVSVANAFVIRARAEDCSLLTAEDVTALTDNFKAEKSIHVANLMHNAGRYFLAKRERAYHLRAAQYLEFALDRYGTDANFHHRAAANFWKSQAWEKIGDMEKTIEAMEESVRLWDEQRKLDPTNKAFAQSGDNAKKRLEELKAKAGA